MVAARSAVAFHWKATSLVPTSSGRGPGPGQVRARSGPGPCLGNFCNFVIFGLTIHGLEFSVPPRVLRTLWKSSTQQHLARDTSGVWKHTSNDSMGPSQLRRDTPAVL